MPTEKEKKKSLNIQLGMGRRVKRESPPLSDGKRNIAKAIVLPRRSIRIKETSNILPPRLSPFEKQESSKKCDLLLAWRSKKKVACPTPVSQKKRAPRKGNLGVGTKT